MTETLSEFRQRVARLRQEHLLWPFNMAVWNAVCYRDCGATYAQMGWKSEMQLTQLLAIYGHPHSDGFDADRFIADAIAAGVLLDDTAQEHLYTPVVWPVSQTGDKWLWISPYIAFGAGLNMARIEERDGKFWPTVRVGDAVSTVAPFKVLADAQAWLVATIGRSS